MTAEETIMCIAFGKRLRKERELRRLTQASLGTRLGCNASYIVHMEQGKRKPSREMCKNIAGTLGIACTRGTVEFYYKEEV